MHHNLLRQGYGGTSVVVQGPTPLKSAVTERCYSGFASRRRASKSRGRVSIAIETKFRSGQGEITVRTGETLIVGGFPEEKDSLKQARGSAKAVSQLIAENCPRHEWVTPIVVFVGDWKIRNDWHNTDMRVFTPDGLLRYIRNQQPQLTHREIELIASHLERCARA